MTPLSDIEDLNRVDLFVCVDIDRTVLRTTTLFTDYVEPLLLRLVDERAGDDTERNHGEQIVATLLRDMRENVGKSFDFLAAYNERVDETDRLDPKKLAELVLDSMSEDSQVKRAVIDRLMAPGAIEVLRQIDDLTSGNWGFITSGGRQTQELKVYIVERILSQELGLKVAAQIISTEHKARDIDTVWRQPGGGFLVPEELSRQGRVLAGHVILIDDKPKNLIVDDASGITTILTDQLDMPDDGQSRLPFADVVQLIHNIDKK